jgi:2-polyprenyl-3-methyl-5-hydroxy-6-metoxy-1,4-benzoquinol methylase
MVVAWAAYDWAVPISVSPFARDLVPERMDDPHLDERAHHRALAGLRRINLVSRTAAALLQKITDYAARRGVGSLRLLDVASGGGDVPIATAMAAARRGLRIDLTLFDRSLVALEHAKQSGVAIQTIQGDAVRQIPGPFDIVTNSLFLHHLTEADARAVLRNMHEAAAGLLLVSDLRRSRVGWLVAHVACRVLSRSPVVHYDGPVSVRAAWTPDELGHLARAAGLSDFRIHGQWPGRMLLESERS